MNLPNEKGTYVLILHLRRKRRLRIGRLGVHTCVPGFYAYVGSAFGSGGLKARIGHHLNSAAAPRWHIDYLRKQARIAAVWYAVSRRKLEQEVAERLTNSPKFSVPVAGFGATDDYRPGSSHLFYSKRRPSLSAFVAGAPGAGFVLAMESDLPMLASKPAVASVMPRA